MKQSSIASPKCYVEVQQLQWPTEAERITTIQKRMQHVSASLLSTSVFQSESYVLQELQPVKDTIKFKLLKDRYRDMYQVIDNMGMLTASAQLRSGGIQGSSNIDDLMAFGNSSEWQEPLVAYAEKYAKKVITYYRQYLRDFKEGVFKLK